MEDIKFWEVTAEARDWQTKAAVGPRRAEKVSSANPVFARCATAQEVLVAYEAFWNRPGSVEQVKVISVWRTAPPNAGNRVPPEVARQAGAAPVTASPVKVRPTTQRRLARRAAQRAFKEAADAQAMQA